VSRTGFSSAIFSLKNPGRLPFASKEKKNYQRYRKGDRSAQTWPQGIDVRGPSSGAESHTKVFSFDQNNSGDGLIFRRLLKVIRISSIRRVSDFVNHWIDFVTT